MNETNLTESQRIKMYIQHQRRLELQRDTLYSGDVQTVPQYILDARNELESEVEVIYLSSDDEDQLDNGYDSEDSFHTAKDELEEDIIEIDTGSNHTVYKQVEVYPNDIDVIEISSDDSDVEFLYERPKRSRGKPKKASHTVSENARLPDYVESPPHTVRENTRLPNYVPILYNQFAQIALSARHLPKICSYCGITTDCRTDSLTSLVYQLGRHHCLGCFRFRSSLRGFHEEEDAIKWLITGKHPAHDQPRYVGQVEFINSLRRRRDFMEERVLRHRKGGDGSELVTTAELYDLCVESDFRCVITGHYLYPGRKAYWALSLDHKIPLKDSGGYPMSWSKANIQLMCHLLNIIKGHFSDETLIRWYTHFIEAKKSERMM